MELKQLFNDDDAVSPVIGVILMVAITVILAAVIATFVLGLGEQVSDTAPQASFNFDYESGTDSNIEDDFGKSGSEGNGNLTITHSGGATITASQLSIAGSSPHGERVDWGSDETGVTAPYGANSEISSGDDATIRVSDGDNIRVVWQNEQGTDSATLRNYEVDD